MEGPARDRGHVGVPLTKPRGSGERGGLPREHFLEFRIPPLLVGLIAAGGMWIVARFPPILDLPTPARVTGAVALAAVGVAVALGGIVSFRLSQTTVNPLKPASASALVSTGIYSVTRNPMYLGAVLALFGWAAYLSSLWALPGPILFALYMTRFQIVPEERALDRLFGAQFADYKTRVRRWL